ncbi:hypothetical protein LCGC14_2898720 [marine sediment metagenome]|uniref:Uncharacterized protein n=1 Tax=marine sediment metagenome TaxID=412755 RepID=A0A0F9AL97_9ZZZZ
MLHPDLVARMVRMLSPTELNRRKRQKLVELISEYVPEDRLKAILDEESRNTGDFYARDEMGL